MNEVAVLVSLFWIAVGAVAMYFSDKKAYSECMIDDIVLHNRWAIIYSSYKNEEGEDMLDIQIQEEE